MRRAPVLIGDAWYRVDMLVVPGAKQDLLLGHPFMIEYGVTYTGGRSSVRMGVKEGTMLRNIKYRPYQSVPIAYQGKCFKWTVVP